MTIHGDQPGRARRLQAQAAGMLNVSKAELSGSLSDISIPAHEYIAYTAVQMLLKDKCLQIISCDEEKMEEAQEFPPSMEEDEVLCYLHESVESVEPSP